MKIRNLVKYKCLNLLLVIFLFFSHQAFSQIVFFQETFRGGTTGAGFSTALGSGSGNFDIYIEPGSTIKKAWLIVQRQGFPPSIQIPINGINYIIDSSNTFIEFSRGGGNTTCHKLALHILDITNNINPLVTNYNITIPPNIIGNSACWWYSAIYIIVLYENNILPIHHSIVLINDKEITDDINYFTANISPINTSYPVGFSIFSDRIGSPSINDGSLVYFNTNFLGVIGGSDAVNSSWSGAAVKGHFYYQNNQLFGLDDDTSDSLMNNTDGLANVNGYIINNSTSFNYRMKTQGINDNTNWYNAWFLTYTPSTPCDTFTTTSTTNLDTICAGENIQLNASGGATYSWFSAFSTFNDSTLANPVAMPTQTTTYIVTIKNDSGCVKTEHVKVWVNPAPKPDTITTSPQRCGSANGSIVVGTIPQGTAPFNYQLTNLTTGNLQSQISNSFNSLLAGNYLINITDSNGCVWQSDTLVVAEIHDITANFHLYTLPLVFPEPNPLGTAPLTVYTQNASVNANMYEWSVSDTSGQIASYLAITSPVLEFETGGTFEVCLLAYNNIPTCGDTLCKTIVIAPAPDSLVLVVPNVFSPNNDGSNDNFVLQIQSAHLLAKIEVEIFNRWGQQIVDSKLEIGDLISNLQLPISNFVLWDGTTTTGKEVPEGTYFYVITYTKLTGEKESLKGSVSLLR